MTGAVASSAPSATRTRTVRPLTRGILGAADLRPFVGAALQDRPDRPVAPGHLDRHLRRAGDRPRPDRRRPALRRWLRHALPRRPAERTSEPRRPARASDVNGLAAMGNRLVAGSTSGGFYYVDRVAAEATRVGVFGRGVVSGGDLCVGPGGVLYLTSPAGSRIGGQDDLLRVDPATGVATPIGTTGLAAVYGLIYTGGERNELLGLTEAGVIARIDPRTGAAAQMAVTGVAFWGGAEGLRVSGSTPHRFAATGQNGTRSPGRAVPVLQPLACGLEPHQSFALIWRCR
ncbi:MAG: hypothetical protein MZW92_70930 [Comamonadaceae bacterium]|nr:hypothetical protein [Comamonadaceae bacterium]